MSSLEIYHEKQIRELCALHALNNLFQCRDTFSKAELDNICHSLSPDFWINPHKSILGLGNYDINVIMKALQSKGFEAIWFDRRKDPICLNLNKIYGYILNVPSDYRIGFITLPLRRRHWIAIKEIDALYYNLDSKLEVPKIIGNEQDLMNFLREELDSKDKQLFLVVSEQNSQTWLLDQNYHNNYLGDTESRDAEIIQIKDVYSDQNNFIDSPWPKHS